MKTEQQGPQDQRGDLHVSRAGRVVKRVFQFKEPLPPTRGVLCGRWSVNDKKNLLTCLKKYHSVQYSPLTIWRSVKNRPKSQVLEFMMRLRRKAAAHCENIRKKQPPILTWFQVADELSWLKDDEDLYMTVVPLLSIMTVEANSKQSKNNVLQFSKLYKYLKSLHSDVVLPELTPAESIVLLDCFQHLADTLRDSDTKAQTEFMMHQYKKCFQSLYFASEGFTETRVKTSALRQEKEKEKKAKKATSAVRKASASQSSAQKPLMKAELRKKEPRKRTKKKETTKNVPPEEDKGQGSQDRLETVEESQTGQEVGESSSPADQTESLLARVERIGDDSGSSVNNSTGTLPDMSQQNGESTGESTSGGLATDGDLEKDSANGGTEGTEAAPSTTTDYGDLDPNDPIFLTKFARMFSLGSLNPFEIPPHLINIGPKRQDDQFENDWASASSPAVIDDDNDDDDDDDGDAEGNHTASQPVANHTASQPVTNHTASQPVTTLNSDIENLPTGDVELDETTGLLRPASGIDVATHAVNNNNNVKEK